MTTLSSPTTWGRPSSLPAGRSDNRGSKTGGMEKGDHINIAKKIWQKRHCKRIGWKGTRCCRGCWHRPTPTSPSRRWGSGTHFSISSWWVVANILEFSTFHHFPNWSIFLGRKWLICSTWDFSQVGKFMTAEEKAADEAVEMTNLFELIIHNLSRWTWPTAASPRSSWSTWTSTRRGTTGRGRRRRSRRKSLTLKRR